MSSKGGSPISRRAWLGATTGAVAKATAASTTC